MRLATLLDDLLWRPSGWALPKPDAADLDGMLSYHSLDFSPDASGYVVALSDAQIVGNMRLVASGRGVVLSDLQFMHGSGLPPGDKGFSRPRIRFPRYLRGVSAVLAASNGNNYYHWLIDSLPRLRMLELAGYRLSDIDHFLVNDHAPAFQTQSLARLGVGPDRIQRASKHRILHCERLLVPSMPAVAACPTLWICQYLRERFLSSESGSGAGRSFYISRAHARGRRVVNESELLPVLERHGIEVVHAERLSLDDQFELFASARKIVAVHGAGLTNLVFCRPGTDVLELRSPLHTENCFRIISQLGGLNYRAMLLQDVPAGRTKPYLVDLIADADAIDQDLAGQPTHPFASGSH